MKFSRTCEALRAEVVKTNRPIMKTIKCHSGNGHAFETCLSTHFTLLIFIRLLIKYLIVYVGVYNKLLIITCIRKNLSK